MNIIDYSVFRERLAKLIERSGKTRVSICDATNLTPATLYRYLSGDRTPDLEYVYRLATYFKVSIDYLVGLDNNEPLFSGPKESSMIQAYRIASDDDKEIISILLRKYMEQLDSPEHLFE